MLHQKTSKLPTKRWSSTSSRDISTWFALVSTHSSQDTLATRSHSLTGSKIAKTTFTVWLKMERWVQYWSLQSKYHWWQIRIYLVLMPLKFFFYHLLSGQARVEQMCWFIQAGSTSSDDVWSQLQRESSLAHQNHLSVRFPDLFWPAPGTHQEQLHEEAVRLHLVWDHSSRDGGDDQQEAGGGPQCLQSWLPHPGWDALLLLILSDYKHYSTVSCVNRFQLTDLTTSWQHWWWQMVNHCYSLFHSHHSSFHTTSW